MHLIQISLTLDTIVPLVGLIAMGSLALTLRHLIFSYTKSSDQIKSSGSAFTYLLVFIGLIIVALGVATELSRSASTIEPAANISPHPATTLPNTPSVREKTNDYSHVEVPNVVGLTAQVAKLKLLDRGLGVAFNNAKGETISDITDLTVIAQYRTPGVFVEPQTVIKLEVSHGDEQQDDDGTDNADHIEIDPFADSSWDLEDAPYLQQPGSVFGLNRKGGTPILFS